MSFKENRYEIVPGVIPDPLLRAAQEYFNILFLQDKFEKKNLEAVPGDARDRYCDALATTLQESLQALMEERTGLTLLPTYNYTRIYQPGTPLLPHTDRAACEVSATLTIQNIPDEIWPLFVRTLEDKTVQVDLEPGDIMIYRGMDLPHWREPGNVRQTGIFLHWVDANGPYTEHHGDPKRRNSYRNLSILNDKRAAKKLESSAATFKFS